MNNNARKFNFITATKCAMAGNNLWTCTEDTLRQELKSCPLTHEEVGDPSDLFTFNMGTKGEATMPIRCS